MTRSILLLAHALLLTAPCDSHGAPLLRGVVETAAGETLEGGIRFEGKTLLLTGSEGQAQRSFGPEEFKVARLQAAGAPQAGKPIVAPHGLTGSYFPGTDFKGVPMQRVDRNIQFLWNGKPPLPGLTSEGFSVRWTGELVAPLSGPVTFHTRTNDGVRLWIGERLLVDQWRTMHATEHQGEIPMEQGQRFPIVMEYFQGTADSEANLYWSGPALEKEAVPESELFSKANSTKPLRRDIGLLLTGGSFLAGSLLAVDDESVTLGYVGDRLLRIPKRNIAGLQFRRLDPSGLSEVLARKPGCTLRSDEHFEAHLASLEHCQVGMHSPLFGRRTYAQVNVKFIKLADLERKEASFVIRTSSGSEIRADWLRLDAEKAMVKDNSICWVNLEPGDVASVYGGGG